MREPAVTAADLAEELDVVFVTHQHSDHCNGPTLRTLVRRSRCVFVLPRTCLAELADLKLPPDRLVVPEPLRPFEVHGARVEPIHAIHGDHHFTVLTREAGFIEGIRYNCG